MLKTGAAPPHREHVRRAPYFGPKYLGHYVGARALGFMAGFSQSVSELFHGPAPLSPLHRLAVRLRHYRSNTSTEYSLPGATQLKFTTMGALFVEFIPMRLLRLKL